MPAITDISCAGIECPFAATAARVKSWGTDTRAAPVGRKVEISKSNPTSLMRCCAKSNNVFRLSTYHATRLNSDDSAANSIAEGVMLLPNRPIIRTPKNTPGSNCSLLIRISPSHTPAGNHPTSVGYRVNSGMFSQPMSSKPKPVKKIPDRFTPPIIEFPRRGRVYQVTFLKDTLNNSLPSRVASHTFSNTGIFSGFSRFEAVFADYFGLSYPEQGLCPVFRRTHACAPINWRRTIHKLDSANSVTSWAVFFLRPR